MIPTLSKIPTGAQTFNHGDAHWGPLACSEHAERGFTKSCGSCHEVARETIEHALAVDADRRRL